MAENPAVLAQLLTSSSDCVGNAAVNMPSFMSCPPLAPSGAPHLCPLAGPRALGDGLDDQGFLVPVLERRIGRVRARMPRGDVGIDGAVHRLEAVLEPLGMAAGQRRDRRGF